jgi:hypothetical protein
MLAIRRKCALRPDVGTSAANPLHSATKRMHVSACFRSLFDSDIALLLKGGSACLSQSSAGQKTVPVIKLRWGRVGYIARDIFPIFEHIRGITESTVVRSVRLRRSIRNRVPGEAAISAGAVEPPTLDDALSPTVASGTRDTCEVGGLGPLACQNLSGPSKLLSWALRH